MKVPKFIKALELNLTETTSIVGLDDHELEDSIIPLVRPFFIFLLWTFSIKTLEFTRSYLVQRLPLTKCSIDIYFFWILFFFETGQEKPRRIGSWQGMLPGKGCGITTPVRVMNRLPDDLEEIAKLECVLTRDFDNFMKFKRGNKPSKIIKCVQKVVNVNCIFNENSALNLPYLKKTDISPSNITELW